MLNNINMNKKDLLQSLVKNYQEGNIEVYEKIENELYKMICKISNKFANTSDDREDIVQVCRVALVKALKTYDADNTTLFSSYYFNVAKNEVLMMYRVEKKHRKVVTDEEGNEIRTILSMDKTMSDDNENNLSEIIPSEDDVEEEVGKKENLKWLGEVIEKFINIGNNDKRNMDKAIKRNIIYGLLKNDNQTELAKELGIHRQTIVKCRKNFINYAHEEAVKEGIIND